MMGALLALGADLALNGGVSLLGPALGIRRFRSGVTPTYLTFALTRWATWFVLGTLLLAVSRLWAQWTVPAAAAVRANDDGGREEEVSTGAHFRLVGLGMMLIPCLWILATWLVVLARAALTGSWGIEGRIFVQANYYLSLLLTYGPWLAAGFVIRVVLGRD